MLGLLPCLSWRHHGTFPLICRYSPVFCKWDTVRLSTQAGWGLTFLGSNHHDLFVGMPYLFLMRRMAEESPQLLENSRKRNIRLHPICKQLHWMLPALMATTTSHIFGVGLVSSKPGVADTTVCGVATE